MSIFFIRTKPLIFPSASNAYPESHEVTSRNNSGHPDFDVPFISKDGAWKKDDGIVHPFLLP